LTIFYREFVASNAISIPDLDGCYAFLGHHPRALYPGRMMTHVAMSAIILVLMGRI
jgi:hypothetical protein